MIGCVLSSVFAPTVEGKIDIGSLQRSGQSVHARLSTIPPVGEIAGAQARPIAKSLNHFILNLFPKTNLTTIIANAKRRDSCESLAKLGISPHWPSN
jgi:hypothetical protein